MSTGKSMLGFGRGDDEEKPFRPNRAQRRAAAQARARAARRATRAWQRGQS